MKTPKNQAEKKPAPAQIEAAKKLQETQTIDERMSPYSLMIEKLKANIPQETLDIASTQDIDIDTAQKTAVNFGEILELKTEAEYTELIAALAFFEEYPLLHCFFRLHKFPRKIISFNKILKEPRYLLNSHVRPEFAYWQPTPLYFITGRKTREKMKDPCKMIKFLAFYGADPNKTAGDGSTPLVNQTYGNGTLEIIKTLLDIGADPNQLSNEGEYEITPLLNCLTPEIRRRNRARLDTRRYIVNAKSRRARPRRSQTQNSIS